MIEVVARGPGGCLEVDDETQGPYRGRGGAAGSWPTVSPRCFAVCNHLSCGQGIDIQSRPVEYRAGSEGGADAGYVCLVRGPGAGELPEEETALRGSSSASPIICARTPQTSESSGRARSGLEPEEEEATRFAGLVKLFGRGFAVAGQADHLRLAR